MINPFRIGTHSGPFHADDVFAVAILKLALAGSSEPIEVIRSRDPKVLETCDVLVDVGGEFDAGTRRFDHHFANPPLDENGAKLAAAGLVWREYATLLPGVSPEVADLVKKTLINPIDDYDTGSLCVINHYTVSHVIGAMNPSWDEPDQDFDTAFGWAVKFASSILDDAIRNAQGLVKAREIANKAIADAFRAGDDRILVLDRYAPIMDYVCDINPDAQFVVYPGPGGDCWMVQCVPTHKGGFDQRVPLLQEWAGLRDQELAGVTGVADAVFVHPGRFIGGAKSKTGAIDMAILASNGQVRLLDLATTSWSDL